ncbi:MAG: hypothetical protein GY913_22320 [Proteobacteria bacterium]|nr:hypothetical protein [Pseudomonadota bacterium]MCP4919647.1 hypothetical protein [Pseudomonadota bacterium]
MFLLFACATTTTPDVVDDSLHPCNVDSGDQDVRLYENDGQLVVAWDSDELWSVAVTTPSVKIGGFGRLESGAAHWAIGGRDFSELLVSPVFYGTTPAEADDYSAYMGGDASELDPERCYEVQVSDLHHVSFGSVQFRLSELPPWR